MANTKLRRRLLLGAALCLLFITEVAAASPTYQQAVKLCDDEYQNCTNGHFGVQRNPYGGSFYILGGCDSNKANGNLDLPTWKKCREWCDATHTQCLKDAKEAF